MKIGDDILDKITGKIEMIVNVTSNSVEITRTKLTKNGIDCTNWFSIDDRKFKDRFIII